VTVDGKIKLGPAMIPCLNYEEYETPVIMKEIVKKYGFLFKANPEFYKALI
jgi:hypothetical protein